MTFAFTGCKYPPFVLETFKKNELNRNEVNITEELREQIMNAIYTLRLQKQKGEYLLLFVKIEHEYFNLITTHKTI